MALKLKRFQGRVFYKCNGRACSGCIDCEPYYHSEHPGINRDKYLTKCTHTPRKFYAKNGSIKGPINFLKRFKIHIKPYIWFEEQ